MRWAIAVNSRKKASASANTGACCAPHRSMTARNKSIACLLVHVSVTADIALVLAQSYPGNLPPCVLPSRFFCPTVSMFQQDVGKNGPVVALDA